VDRLEMRRLLKGVRSGRIGVAEAMDRLRQAPVEEMGFAALDLHRALRRGFPEVVFGPGKTIDQVVKIVDHLHRARQTALVTRVGPDVFEAVAARHPGAEYRHAARMVTLRAGRNLAKPRPGIVVLSAGTSDIPVAEEAAVTAEMMGNLVQRVYDVGVAGLHRLLSHRKTLMGARVIVAVAGMEGALPSVVSGLTSCPVIGVPTSVGYGVGPGGQAALMAMLNSCSSGMTVVNIDNGFGAGCAASLINRLPPSRMGKQLRTRAGKISDNPKPLTNRKNQNI